jgi:hypothetical protein
MGLLPVSKYCPNLFRGVHHCQNACLYCIG